MGKPRLQLHLPDLYVGGIERWALTLMDGAPEFDWVVSVPPGAVSHPAGLEDFRRFPIVEESDSSTKPDALITTWGTSNRSVTPTIAVAHSAFQKYREMMQSIRYDFAVAVSKAACGCFPDPSTVAIIYNGVDLGRLHAREPRAAVRARLGIPDEAKVIGYVGRWGFQKNPLAAARAAGQIPGAVALYIGPRPDVDQLADAARIATCCFVAPEEVGQIGDLYAAMDVCLFASRTEGFGLAIAEAWYAQTPVVATTVGIAAEHPDLVRMLPQEPTDLNLKRAIEGVLSGDSGLDLRAGRKIVEDLYSSSAMIKAWKSYIYSKL